MNWYLLGIEETKDKGRITAAYRAQLASVNPEDKPEEFKALRAAYEEALRLADMQEAAPARDESPVGLWMERVRRLYSDFPARIDPEHWRALLRDDVCVGLDSRSAAEEALLQFLMQDFYLPQSVWQVLDSTFSWMERRSELYENFPKDFVDYAVINGIRYPNNLPYELFIPGKDAAACDEYRRIYYQANQTSNEELPPLLDKLKALPEGHPYGDLLSYRLMLAQGEIEEGRAGYRRLADSYPDDSKLLLEWAAQCINTGNWAEAEENARHVLSLRPEAVQARELLAQCLAQQHRLEEAKEQVFRLMDAAGGDQKRIFELRKMVEEWNEALVSQWEAHLQTTPEDDVILAKLAWCYLQNDRDQDALSLCRRISPRYEDRYDYHNLYAKTTYAMGDYAAALPHLQEAEALLRVMTPDGTDKTAQRIASLPEKIQMQGSCLINMGQQQEAVAKYEEALAIAPNDPEVLTHTGRLWCGIGDLQRAAAIFETLTNVLPGSYHGFYLLAQVRFDLGQDRDAFDAVNRALELDGSDLGVYILKLRILLRNGAWEAVRSTVDFLHQHGITDEMNTLWCEAQLLEQGEGQKEKALDLYRTLAQRVENGEDMIEPAKLYFRLLLLEAANLDANKAEDRAKMLALTDKALSYDENDLPSLDYKAWLLKRDGKRDEAIAIYLRLEKESRRNMGVEEELAELYYADLDRDADKALHYYKLLLANEERTAYLFYAGTCCRYLKLYEEGEGYFLRLQELNSEGVDGFNGLSYLYDTMGRYEDALTQINEVIARAVKREGNQSGYFYHKVRTLRRLNRPYEALATIDEVTEKYGNDEVYQEKFEICCQFALWKEAEDILKQWRKSRKQQSACAAAEIDLLLFRGDIEGGRKALRKAEKKLNASDRERLTLLLGELDGDEAVQMSIWEKRMANRSDTTHELMNMAQVQWWNGHYDKAREYAAAALQQIEDLLPDNKKHEALYRSRRTILLAMLGRFEEAEAELAAVRSLPLCEHCNYCACKDADIFEANIEEIRGNYEQALKLHLAGADRWSDDMDFISGARRMRRKGL